ncbi:MAG: CDP-alcohol phosphatidyltransferase family protein [Candidatus Cloacimonetes bacterium]|nr:CDP-alcohol phosphatidyltransferase family protein [Candidatus Cloacimonadota bacterium]
MGLIGLHYLRMNEYSITAWLLAASILMDGLDGKIARWLHASSRFGCWFDTISDFLVFGVLPGILVYFYQLNKLQITGLILTGFYILCGGFRLIRFTIKTASLSEKKPFIGLPIPAAAGWVASFILIQSSSFPVSPLFTAFSMLMVSLLMISKIIYLPLEIRKFPYPLNLLLVGVLIIIMVAAIWKTSWVFFVLIIIYIISGPVSGLLQPPGNQ